MNDEEITKDRQKRVSEAKGEIEAVLNKYELGLVAEESFGLEDKIKITVAMSFRDTKKYPEADLAQEDKPILSEDIMKDILDTPGDPIN